MKINYKKRCETGPEPLIGVYYNDDLECRIIRYGMTANEANAGHDRAYWHDVETSYADLSRGGRKPGNPIEMEYKLRKHYFNKRIQTDEEKWAGQRVETKQRNDALRGDSGGDDQRAPDEGGSIFNADEVTFSATGLGSGDRVSTEVRDAAEGDGGETKEDGNPEEVA